MHLYRIVIPLDETLSSSQNICMLYCSRFQSEFVHEKLFMNKASPIRSGTSKGTLKVEYKYFSPYFSRHGSLKHTICPRLIVALFNCLSPCLINTMDPLHFVLRRRKNENYSTINQTDSAVLLRQK